ncbi:MAG: DUF2974 domain-containing protein [Lachnospiraceae bacterium]|nr:DUF2974 domain-containing protein [Lachnospiraceae bacterium]
MGTILNYLEQFGKYTFSEMPMTELDSLALCQLSYLKFEGMVPGAKDGLASVTLKSLESHPEFEKLFADVRFEKNNRALMRRMLEGKRFGGIRLNHYVNIVEEKWETQFSAITCELDDKTVYVAYRGTDETIVGWKEDFNMAFISPVPAQECSVMYLEAVAEKLPGPLYLGGHSKGGNLAVYSAMNCREEIQDRIVRIYSMDGPGFRPEVLERCGYEKIAERVEKILPHSSLVGMLFESDMHYRVVKSKTIGLAQHDPYTWLVTGNHLVKANDVYERRKHMDNTLNQWILSLDEQQLRTFVDTLFQVISASDVDNLIDLTAEWRKSMNGIISAMKELDGQTSEMLKNMIKSLFEMAGSNMKKEVVSKTEATLSLISQKTKPERKNRTKPAPR